VRANRGFKFLSIRSTIFILCIKISIIKRVGSFVKKDTYSQSIKTYPTGVMLCFDCTPTTLLSHINNKHYLMHQNINFLSIGRTKLIIHQNKKFSSIYQNKTFHPTAEQNSSSIKIKNFHPSTRTKHFIQQLNRTHHPSK
jgi:hypothetical protein